VWGVNMRISDDDDSQMSANHRTYVEVQQPFGGKKIVPLYFPKDKSHSTYDSERQIKKLRLPARISGVCIDACLWVTGSTLFTSIFGRFLLNKAILDWRVGVLLVFVLLVFPLFLYLYTSSKVADIKWAFGLRLLSITFGSIIGGSYG